MSQKNLDKKDIPVQNLTGKLEKSLSLNDGKGKNEVKPVDAATVQTKDYRPKLTRKTNNYSGEPEKILEYAKDKVASKAQKNKKVAGGSASTSKPNAMTNNNATQSAAAPPATISYAAKLKAASAAAAAPAAVAPPSAAATVTAAAPAPVPVLTQAATPSSYAQSRLQAVQQQHQQQQQQQPAPVVINQAPAPVAAAPLPSSASGPLATPVPASSTFVPATPTATPVVRPFAAPASFTNSQQQSSFSSPCTNFDDILKKSSLNPNVIDFTPKFQTVTALASAPAPATATANKEEVEAAVKKLIEDFTERKNFFKQNLTYYVQNHLKPFLSNTSNIDILIRTLINIVLENEDFMYTLVNLLTTCATACKSCDFISQVITTVKSMSKVYNHSAEENNFILVMAYLYQGLAEKYGSQSAPMSEEFCGDIMAMLMTENLPKVKLALRALQVALGRLEREHSSYFDGEVATFLSYLSEQRSEVRDSIQQVIQYRHLLRQYQDEEALHDELTDNQAQYDYVANLSQPICGPDGQALTEEEMHFLNNMSREVDCIRLDQLGEIFDEAYGEGEDEMDDDAYNALDEFLKTIPK